MSKNNSQAVGKKRGRPRRSNKLDQQDEIDSTSQFTDKTEIKQRGRPRRSNKLDQKDEIKCMPEVKEKTETKQTGRPRRSNRLDQKDEVEFTSQVNDKIEIKQRGRPRRSIITSDSEAIKENQSSVKKYSSDSEDETGVETDTEFSGRKRKNTFSCRRKKKRGRPKNQTKKVDKDAEYVPHHEYFRVPSEKRKDKLKETTAGVSSQITCGKCNLQMSKNQWANHNLKEHNDLGWQEGKQNLDFENNIKLVKQTLFIAIRKNKGKLVCEICKLVRRSVEGYISHVNVCGKTEEELKQSMITCPGCQELIHAASLDYHNKKHALQKIKKEREEKEREEAQLLSVDDINADSKTKRKAAQKAVSKISEFSEMSKDDKDDKKPSTNNQFMRKIVQKPKLKKRIPSIAISKWNKQLENSQSAACTQPGCQFSCNSFEEMKEHYSKCNFTPQKNYVCKICKFKTLEKNAIVNHVNQKHPVEDLDEDIKLSEASEASDDDDDDDDDYSIGSDEEVDKSVVRRQIVSRGLPRATNTFKFTLRSSGFIKTSYTFPNAFQWTLNFELKNYQLNLFSELKPNTFELLDKNKLIEFLPKLEESMPMKILKDRSKNSTGEWKKYKRFEGKCVQGAPMFFVGGPIWAIAWLPIPSTLAFSENISQYIAVSTHQSMEAEYTVGKSYQGKNIIQIWNVGSLSHRTDSKFIPQLAYAIAHNGGTIWSLDWCPSGCYEHENLFGLIERNDRVKRLGLLAAGCSDGCVRVYSLIFPEDLPKDDVQNGGNCENNGEIEHYPLYKTDPVLTLIVNISMFEKNEQTWQVTKLSWTKEKNHNVIVAGFSNGYVGLWDLSSKLPLIRHKRNNRIFLHPYMHFMAHSHAVTMVYLVPQDGKRFLATASHDRKYKFWDLENISSPQYSFQKSFVTNGAWLNNWGCAFLTYDDALSMNHNYTYCLPLREYTYNYHNLIPTDSTSYAISTSDFGNSIANGTLAGEVLAMFPHQLLYIRDMERTLREKRAISLVASLEVYDFHQTNNKKSKGTKEEIEYNFMPSTYNESKDRFGLIFHNKVNTFQDNCFKKQPPKKTLIINMMKSVPIEQYPFMSVNRLSWNPNAWSFLWLAVAYQNGFVQLLPFRSLACTIEWDKMLRSHIKYFEKTANETPNVVVTEDTFVTKEITKSTSLTKDTEKTMVKEEIFVTNNLLQELGC